MNFEDYMVTVKELLANERLVYFSRTCQEDMDFTYTAHFIGNKLVGNFCSSKAGELIGWPIGIIYLNEKFRFGKVRIYDEKIFPKVKRFTENYAQVFEKDIIIFDRKMDLFEKKGAISEIESGGTLSLEDEIGALSETK